MNTSIFFKGFVGIVLALFAFSGKKPDLKQIIATRLSQSMVNLIPDEPGKTPSYYCTWTLQGHAASQDKTVNAFGVSGHSAIAGKLTEDLIFGKGGAAWAFDKIRSDMFLVYDLGWDIDPGVNIEKEPWQKGRLILSQEKFPHCTGTPTEQLKALNEMTKKAGWKGAGVWVAAEPFEYGKAGKKQSLEETKEFFEHRASWFKEAGIDYWKVDYGAFKGNVAFRKDISTAGKKIFIENCNVDGPFNDEDCPWCGATVNHTGRFKNWDDGKILKNALAMISFSPVYRTYDVAELTGTTTTLDRVASILEFYNYSKKGGLINCEDEPYIGAALGCAVGIMRHPAISKKRIDEVVRAVRWQRMAPAYAVAKGETAADSTVLYDAYNFKKGETWADWTYGKTTKQLAPARVARGMELPQVGSGKDTPYVVCSRNPSGAITVATLPRLATDKGVFYPLADVTLNAERHDVPIGIFGRYKSLRINFKNLPKKFKIYAQDLAGDKAIDITDLVKIETSNISLSGALLSELGVSAKTDGDSSEPGLVLKIM